MRVEGWIPKLSHMSGRAAAVSETGWICETEPSFQTTHRPSLSRCTTVLKSLTWQRKIYLLIWWYRQNVGFTCDGSLHFQHAFLLAQDGGSLIDDPEGSLLLQPALFDQMSLKDLHTGPPVHVQVFDRQACTGRIWHRCKNAREEKRLTSTGNIHTHGRWKLSLKTERMVFFVQLV